MHLIVGLGNPGNRYARTRHNAGFMALDELARRWAPGQTGKARFHAAVLDSPVKGRRALLMKPTTYMNRSGNPVAEAARFFKIDPADDLLVIVDDHALPVGAVRVRQRGGAGGHNGLRDIDRALGGADYARVRIGIGPVPPMMDMADWVLSRFTDEERPGLERSIARAADAAETVLDRGIEAAMNEFNERVRGGGPAQPRTEPGGAGQGPDPGWLTGG
jgi:PTH1 family peptidyl-tRNA hydrolase